ncbi:hypothetical protein KDX30_18695 [Pseudomonas sp. CDFA 553]|uniref:hypothetical protein n=1 Tax=Pseudomonas quasicaspiana TaxID=2829821 RepID=UPI001E4CD153|nr:hypothetical protein [Pseudomonas quasicaspiana]MCD5989927.1 hypothetical protein [Pseudomonas quasicaspiana]
MSEMTSSVVVAGSNLISFMAGLTREEKKDVSDLLRYADYFASQTYDRSELWTSWMGYYRNRLEKFSTVKARIVKEPMVITDAEELEQITASVVGTTGSTSLARLMQHSLRTVRIDKDAQLFFQHGRGSGRLRTFQVVGCEKTPAGQILIVLCALHANAYTEVDILGLSERIQRDIVLRISGGVYELDREQYAMQRESITSKLRYVTRLAIQDI